jgi:acetate kinase
MRELLKEQESGNERAKLAIEVFCYRVRKYIAAYCGVLGRVDGLIFTGGIGENAPAIRAVSCERLKFFGIEIDPEKNEKVIRQEGLISPSTNSTQVYVIPTNEELLIARDTVRTVLGIPHLS